MRDDRWVALSAKTCLLAACLALGLLPASCGQAPHPQEGAPVRVAVQPSLAAAPFFIAREERFFADQGLTILETRYPDGAAAAEALLAGAADVAYIGSAPFLIAAAKADPPLAAVAVAAVSNGSEGIIVKGGSGLERPADLEGRRAAAPFGSSAHRFLLEVLTNAGLHPGSDVFLLDLSPERQLEAFAAGQADAVALWEPFKRKAVLLGGRVLIDDSLAVVRNLDLIVVRSEWAEARPGLIADFLRGHFAAAHWLNEQTDAAARILADRLGQSTGRVRYALDFLLRPGPAEQVQDEAGKAMMLRTLGTEGKFLYNQGLVHPLPNPQLLVQTGYLERMAP